MSVSIGSSLNGIYLRDVISIESPSLLCAWDSPGKDTGVGGHALLQGILPTQGWKPGLLHYRRILYRLSHQGRPSNKRKCLSLSRVRVFATPHTAARRAPPSMGFSRQQSCSGWPCPPPGIFPTQGSNPGHLWILYIDVVSIERLKSRSTVWKDCLVDHGARIRGQEGWSVFKEEAPKR